jgi:hypothetical protein
MESVSSVRREEDRKVFLFRTPECLDVVWVWTDNPHQTGTYFVQQDQYFGMRDFLYDDIMLFAIEGTDSDCVR